MLKTLEVLELTYHRIFFAFLVTHRCNFCNITNNLVTATGDGGINHFGGVRTSLTPSGNSENLSENQEL